MWERYYDLVRQGYSRTAASRMAGISLNAVRSFEAGDSASSGHVWLKWRQALREGAGHCPTCDRSAAPLRA